MYVSFEITALFYSVFRRVKSAEISKETYLLTPSNRSYIILALGCFDSSPNFDPRNPDTWSPTSLVINPLSPIPNSSIPYTWFLPCRFLPKNAPKRGLFLGHLGAKIGKATHLCLKIKTTPVEMAPRSQKKNFVWWVNLKDDVEEILFILKKYKL